MGRDIEEEIGKYILRFSDEGQAHLWDSEYGDNYDVIEMPRLKALVRQRDELLEAAKAARTLAKEIMHTTGAEPSGMNDAYGESEIFNVLNEAIKQAEAQPVSEEGI